MIPSRTLRPLALAASLGASLCGQAAAETLTLAEVEARAQRSGRAELTEQGAQIDRARAEVDAVQAKTGPTLVARGELGLAPGGVLVTVVDAQDGDNYFVQGSRTLGQEDALAPVPRYAALLAGKVTLLDFGRTALGVRAAEAAMDAERASLLRTKIELVNGARQAYLAWLEAYETWQLARRDGEVAASRTASVRALIAEGARPATDATLSSYDEQLARLREARARRASTAAFQALSAAVASELPEAAVPDPAVIEAPAAAAAAAPPEPDDAVARDAALRAIDRQRDAALTAARAADRAWAPQLEVSAEFGVHGQDSRVFPMYRTALSLSVPIFDGGAQSALADQRRAEGRALEARRQLVEERLRAQQLAARTALNAAREELGMSLELLSTAEALLSEAEDHYRAGSDTLERVLSSQRSLVQARREVLSAKLETARARLALEPIQLRD